jgi:cell fate regulator YaaT (PSP1 superfamily)
MVLPTDYQPFNIVEVRFKGSRKEFFRNAENLDLYTGDTVVVETDFGHDVAHISLSGELVRLQLKKANLTGDEETIRKIYRKANTKDKETYTEMKAKEQATLERSRTIAIELRLEMKLSDIEFQGDGRKVILFYTAEGRVDFRELIKRFAAEFRTRIEMRQVSYREEASRLGAIGSCGRELCCSTWLTDYKVVAMSAARQQNLSINMLKLSGQCGRLKCCLNYELDMYLEALKEFPRDDKLALDTINGRAYLQKTDILKRVMRFAFPKTTEWYALDLERVNEVIALNKNGEKPDSLVVKDYALSLMEANEPAADLISDQDINRMDELDAERKRKSRNNSRNKKGGGNRKPRSQQARSNEGGHSTNRNTNRKPRNDGNKTTPQAQNQSTTGEGSDKPRRPNPNRNKNRKPRPPKPPTAE